MAYKPYNILTIFIYCIMAMLSARIPCLAVTFAGPTELAHFPGFITTRSIAVGPEDPNPFSNKDGCVYVGLAENGAVYRLCFDEAKTLIQDLTGVVINLRSGLDGTLQDVQNLLGIAFDPAPPAGEIHLYLSYAPFPRTLPFQGFVARAVSTDGGRSYVVDEHFLSGLPSGTFNHQTNGMAFGPDGCLYIAQGSPSNEGFDSAQAESRLSGAILRACFKTQLGDVDPKFDRDCGHQGTQEACDIEVYASGMRNSYDLVWHTVSFR